ncbi:MAG TPA: divalent-cation tolerance protein CutA [Polyangiaceae bacterium]|nr:divalent-cation tolerance protein CutA [Polyangiaceae bacterium]
MSELVSVYVTAPSREVALQLAREVVEARLAACANVWSGVTSVYEWQGVLTEEAEVVLVLKTRRSAFEALRARLVAAHPYEVPCVVCQPILAGHEPFLDWVRAQVDGSD